MVKKNSMRKKGNSKRNKKCYMKLFNNKKPLYLILFSIKNYDLPNHNYVVVIQLLKSCGSPFLVTRSDDVVADPCTFLIAVTTLNRDCF